MSVDADGTDGGRTASDGAGAEPSPDDPRDVTGLAGPVPTAIAFDIGEVLIDETRVWDIWADLVGVSHLSFAAVFGAAIVQGQDHRAVFPHVAPNIDWTELTDEHERRYGGFQEQDLYPDVRPCLDELATQGLTVILAGNQPAQRRDELERLDLPCDRIATSADFGVEKPDPDFFDAVLDLARAADPARVLYVGDRVDNDVLPAAAAGLRTCWLRRGPFGHLQDLTEDLTPDLTLEGLGELSVILAGWRADTDGDQEDTA